LLLIFVTFSTLSLFLVVVIDSVYWSTIVSVNQTPFSTWLSCLYCSWCSLLSHVHVLRSVQGSSAEFCGSAGRDRPMNSNTRCSCTSSAAALTTVQRICRQMIRTTWDIHDVKRCCCLSVRIENS